MKPPAKITVEAVTGYRMWYVETDGTLHGLFDQFEWPMREPAEAVYFGATEGFYAYPSAAKAWQGMDEIWNEAPHLYLAIGTVAMWGQLDCDESCEFYRSSHAYPVTLWTTYDEETNRRARLAADRYGVEFAARPLELFPPLDRPQADDDELMYEVVIT